MPMGDTGQKFHEVNIRGNDNAAIENSRAFINHQANLFEERMANKY